MELITEWSKCQTEIKAYNNSVKQLKEKSKEYESVIIEYMLKNGLVKVTQDDLQIELKTKKVFSTLKKDYICTTLKDFLASTTDRKYDTIAENATNMLFENRDQLDKHTINLSKK